MNDLLRNLPRVDDILDVVKEDLPRMVLLASIREVLDNTRAKITAGQTPNTSHEEIARQAIALARAKITPSLKRVINATGIVLHTNLGRATMSEKVAEHVKQIAMDYSTLEYDPKTGKRGSRTGAIENLLTNLTGAEAACIVNNNAAAVLLTLTALCQGGEVIVSRGEFVEIGGSFRVPDVIAQSGAILREVGTTNKTHLSDYKQAIETAAQTTPPPEYYGAWQNFAPQPKAPAVLKVHTSNYKIVGFTAEVAAKELATLGALSIYDLGAGTFIPFEGEETVQEAVKSGMDIVCFSGDKLLGGPQCGIILGKKEYVEKIRKHPLYRALRADKLSLAALEATMLLYQDIDNAKHEIPTLKMLLATGDELKEKAARLLGLLHNKYNAKLQEITGLAGGGSLPTQEFKSWAVAITHGAEKLEKHMRDWETPIIARIHKGTLLLDVRTIDETEFPIIAECLYKTTA